MIKQLEESLLEFVINSTSKQVEHVANKVATSTPNSFEKIAETSRTPMGKQRLSKLLKLAKDNNISASEFSGMLRGVAWAHENISNISQVDLIWTGPSTNLVSTRKTEPALIQIVKSAKSKLFLTSFVAYSFPTVLSALAEAINRNVDVSMLLESSTAHGGGVSFDVIGQMKSSLPQANIYSWDEKSNDYIGGKVHAKVAVADHNQCFISSANLTTHAMERNMEAGVIIIGGDIPSKLHSHLEALVTTRVISKIKSQ